MASGSPAPGGYVGPGDVTTFSAWWGLRGYNTAYSGNAANICTPLDALCLDVAIVAGALNTTTLGTLACNNTTTICTVKTLYDQTGNGNSVTQATIATRPKYVAPGAANGCPTTLLPCMSFAGTVTNQFLRGTITTINQQFSISAVVERSADTSSFNPYLTGGGFGGYFLNSTNNVMIYAGTVSSAVAASDNSYHSLQSVFNSAASILTVDGVDTTGLDVSTGAFSTPTSIGDNGAGGNFLGGFLSEDGVASGGFSGTVRTNLCHNQRLYYTLSGSC